MIKVKIPNSTDRGHLRTVQSQMKVLGDPKVRVFYSNKNKTWYAIEGSHRLTSAKKLGMKPKFIDITKQKSVQGTQYSPVTEGEKVSMKKLVDYIENGGSYGPVIQFDEYVMEQR